MYKKRTLRIIIKILQDRKVHICSSAGTLLWHVLHHLSLLGLFCLMACTSVQCLLHFCVCCESGSMHLNSMCCRVFIHHVERRCWKVVHSFAVDIMFLVTTWKEGPGSGLLCLLGMCHILQMCALHVRIFLVKLKTLHSAWLILGHIHCVHYYDTFYLIHAWQVNMDCMGSGNNNNNILFFSYKSYQIQSKSIST